MKEKSNFQRHFFPSYSNPILDYNLAKCNRPTLFQPNQAKFVVYDRGICFVRGKVEDPLRNRKVNGEITDINLQILE
jgi:hypothetical protein